MGKLGAMVRVNTSKYKSTGEINQNIKELLFRFVKENPRMSGRVALPCQKILRVSGRVDAASVLRKWAAAATALLQRRGCGGRRWLKLALLLCAFPARAASMTTATEGR